MSTSANGSNELYEAVLHEKSKQSNQMVLNLIQQLGSAMVYPDCSNPETNRKLWDLYAKEWSPSIDWVQQMSSHLPAESDDSHASATQSATAGEVEVKAESPGAAPAPAPAAAAAATAAAAGAAGAVDDGAHRHVGDEWSRPSDLHYVVQTYIRPFVSSGSVAAEIGCGGGRVATLVAPGVASLRCFDISQQMLARAKHALAHHSNVTFDLVRESCELPAECKAGGGVFDFVYSFDVFVHIDLHTTWRYFQEIAACLKPGGRFFVSTATLSTPDGWARFASQSQFTVGGFYFHSPDTVRMLGTRCGLQVVQESEPDASNIYLNRDFLVVFEKGAE